jgi:hypothetical protein
MSTASAAFAARDVSVVSTRTLVLVLVWVVSAVYLLHSRNTIFYPLDEGMLAENAQRVLSGQLPHRDFADVYTGGLNVLGAAAFLVWGVNLTALRDLLCGAALLWVPVLYEICVRFTKPWAAGLVVVTAVAWSVPYYPLGMASWYVLFLASAGMLALLVFIERRRRRWLVAAGLAAGAACAIKITGLYFIGAALLVFVFLEQDASRVESRPRLGVYAWLIVAASVLFAAAVAVLVRSQGIDAVVAYVVPNAAVAGLLIWRELADGHAGGSVRVRRYLGLALPFLLGVAVPVAAFVAPYVWSGAVGALVNGVFVVPTRRLTVWWAPPFPTITTLAAVPVAAMLGLFSRSPRVRWLIGVAAVVVLVATGALLPYADAASRTPLAIMSRVVRDALHGLVPVLTVVGAVVLARGRGSAAVLVVVSVLATGGLVMFPYAQDVYFHFVMPLIVLAAVALAQPGWGSAAVGVVFLGYAVAQHSLGIMGPAARMVRLDIPRGGPMVTPGTNAMYQRLVAVVGAHAHGRYIYATPDCPDVYFLTGFANPTPTTYEAFDPPADRARAIPALLDRDSVDVAVISRRRYVSGPIDPALASALDQQFPRADTVGWYVVRWRH